MVPTPPPDYIFSIPTPFPVPTPMASDFADALTNVEHLEIVVSAFQSYFILQAQNGLLMRYIFFVFLAALIVAWITSFVSRRSNRV